MTDEIRSFYDEFAARQIRVGINARHRAIRRWLQEYGLRPGMDVLEIGCGIGTQTELIAKDLAGRGRLVALDLSPRSIELARVRLARHSNVTLVAGDVFDIDIAGLFDVVVLPDVIEHIPLDRHNELFRRVRSWLVDDGWAFIHLPNPYFQEWCREHRPELLQVVDQALHLERLLPHLVGNGLYVHSLQTYSVWATEEDYQSIVLRVHRPGRAFHIVAPEPSVLRRLARRVRALLFRNASQEP